ncbi:MAG: hypothetical protein ABSH56_15030 [Bryobacteraceae bacterium]
MKKQVSFMVHEVFGERRGVTFGLIELPERLVPNERANLRGFRAHAAPYIVRFALGDRRWMIRACSALTLSLTSLKSAALKACAKQAVIRNAVRAGLPPTIVCAGFELIERNPPWKVVTCLERVKFALLLCPPPARRWRPASVPAQMQPQRAKSDDTKARYIPHAPGFHHYYRELARVDRLI